MKTRSAFTLLELLLVISIIGILSTLVAPAINTIMHGSRMTQGGDRLVAALNQARQAALTTNHAVEVRFYKYGDGEVPGEKSTDPSSGKYRALQAYEYKDDGTVTPVGKMEKMPPSVIIDSNTTLSSLLTKTKDWGTGSDGNANTPVSLPVVGTNYNCCAFRFLADGSTNLAKTAPGKPTGGWFVTVHNLKDGDNLVTPPANYTTIIVDPVNGALKVYRP